MAGLRFVRISKVYIRICPGSVVKEIGTLMYPIFTENRHNFKSQLIKMLKCLYFELIMS